MTTNYHVSLADLQQQLASVEAERVKLQAREDALRKTIEGIEQLAMLGFASAPAPQIENTQEPEPEEGAISVPPAMFRRITHIAKAVSMLLEYVKRPLKTRAILDALLAGGFKTKAQFPYTTIRSVLGRELKEKGTFTYNENKEWGLPEWETGEAKHRHSIHEEAELSANQEYALEP